MTNFIVKLNDYLSLVLAIYTIIIFFVGILSKKILNHFRIYKLKKVLSFENKKCLITIPEYNREFFEKSDLFWKKTKFVILGEAVLQTKLSLSLQNAHINTGIFVDFPIDPINEIHIGGPIINRYTNSYMINFFPFFKHCLTSIDIESYPEVTKTQLFFNIVESNSNQKGFRYGINNEDVLVCIEHQTNYAILIKLVNDDFNSGDKKTVHLLFGENYPATNAAVNYFIKNYLELYKRFKNNHYFVALKINSLDGSVDISTGIIDLTEKMFAF